MRELPPNQSLIGQREDGKFYCNEICPDYNSMPRDFSDCEYSAGEREVQGHLGRSLWLDHAAKVRGAAGMSSDPFGVHATIRPNPEWLHAMKQADLWAKWGKNAD